MTREEAIRILASSCIPGSKQTEALETLIPELAESEDERIRKYLIDELKVAKSVGELKFTIPQPTREECIAYLEKQKEVGIQWLKSDNVKNPDKPYIDKAGMFYTTDGRMCYASEIEKQKEHQELPLMNGDADLYFDTWRQEVPVPTFRQCFEEGMRYAQRLQKEQKPINHNFTTFHRDVVYCAMCDKNLDEGLRCNLEIVYKIIKDIVDRTPVVEEQKPAESISQLAVQGKGVYKICPRCKERMVRDDSMVYTSMPPQYRYECPKCGESECDTVMYDNPEKETKKYIDADLLKKEIERQKSLFSTEKEKEGLSKTDKLSLGARIASLEETIVLIDSLQQEQKEADLDADIKMEWDSFNKHIAKYSEGAEVVVWLNWFSFVDIANYFYELGLNAKEER